jgi:hypothetical protein
LRSTAITEPQSPAIHFGFLGAPDAFCDLFCDLLSCHLAFFAVALCAAAASSSLTFCSAAAFDRRTFVHGKRRRKRGGCSVYNITHEQGVGGGRGTFAASFFAAAVAFFDIAFCIAVSSSLALISSSAASSFSFYIRMKKN